MDPASIGAAESPLNLEQTLLRLPVNVYVEEIMKVFDRRAMLVMGIIVHKENTSFQPLNQGNRTVELFCHSLTTSNFSCLHFLDLKFVYLLLKHLCKTPRRRFKLRMRSMARLHGSWLDINVRLLSSWRATESSWALGSMYLQYIWK